MNARISWPLAAAVLVAGCSRDANAVPRTMPRLCLPGVAFVDAVERKPDDANSQGSSVVIPYRRFRLDNGLTVILHRDTSDPLVHVDVTYHVGSAREDVGKSGFAHFFEHMMFQGSENVGDEQHFKIVSESGGTLNGTTSTDRTNYFQTAPSNQLEKAPLAGSRPAGLPARRRHPGEVRGPARHRQERARPDGGQRAVRSALNERVGEAMYPEGHPYSWLTIGYVEDLDRVDVNDLKQFFLRWYGAQQRGVDHRRRFRRGARPWLGWPSISALFRRGPDVAKPDKPPVILDETRYISLEDNVALPLLFIGRPTVYLYHEDEAPLDVLMFILGTGRDLAAVQELGQEPDRRPGPSHAMAAGSCPALFSVIALPNPAAGKTLADLERIVDESLAEFEERGITDDDLLRTKMAIVSGKIYSLESVAGKVSQLAAYQYLTGKPDFAPRDVARYENVTKADVMRVYEQYIKDKPAVVMSIVPHGQAALRAGEDTWERYERTLPDYEKVAAEELDHRRAEDDFDRSVIPPAGANPVVTTLPDIWRGELDNGIAVLGARNVETPTTAIRLRIAAGQRHESVEQLGLAALTASMMDEATELSSNEELSDRLQKLGSSVSFGAANDDTVATVRSLTTQPRRNARDPGREAAAAEVGARGLCACPGANAASHRTEQEAGQDHGTGRVPTAPDGPRQPDRLPGHGHLGHCRRVDPRRRPRLLRGALLAEDRDHRRGQRPSTAPNCSRNSRFSNSGKDRTCLRATTQAVPGNRRNPDLPGRQAERGAVRDPDRQTGAQLRRHGRVLPGRSRELRARRRLQQPHQPEPARGQGLYLRCPLDVRRRDGLRRVHGHGRRARRHHGGINRRIRNGDPPVRRRTESKATSWPLRAMPSANAMRCYTRRRDRSSHSCRASRPTASTMTSSISRMPS